MRHMVTVATLLRKRPSARKLRAGLVFEQVHRTVEIIIKVLFKNFNTKYIIYIEYKTKIY